MAARARRNDRTPQPESNSDVIIALMGETGVGKTSFVRRVTGNTCVRPNHSMYPERSAVASHRFPVTSPEGDRRWNITLIDCPGFDNIQVPDNNIIKSILEYLHKPNEQDRKLHGIIYMLDISQTRIINDALANMNMFKKLVGDEYYQNVILGTTFWDTLPNMEEGERREDEYKREDALWAELKREGSKIRRLGFENRGRYLPSFSKDATSPMLSDLGLLLEICENHQSHALCAQVEMDRGLNSEETSAVRELNEWRERARHHQQQMEQYREDMRVQLASNASRLDRKLEQQCRLMDQAYERQARAFALDQKRLRESRRRINELIEERSSTTQPQHEQIRERIDASRRNNDTTAQELTNKARRSCAFYKDWRKESGIVHARCKPKCKVCKEKINPGEKFFHCCSCKPKGSHNYHHCHGCGKRCGKNHVDMLELQLATR